MDVRTPKERADFIRRMADYEKVSAILWLVLAVVQIVSVFAIIAGVWNIFASISRFGMEKKIRKADPSVPTEYEGLAQLIIIGLINLFFGAAIGVAFVAADFYIRDQILKNRHVFDGEAGETQSESVSGAVPATAGNVLEQLERLAILRDKGALDEAEFLREKQKILGPTLV